MVYLFLKCRGFLSHRLKINKLIMKTLFFFSFVVALCQTLLCLFLTISFPKIHIENIEQQQQQQTAKSYDDHKLMSWKLIG